MLGNEMAVSIQSPAEIRKLGENDLIVLLRVAKEECKPIKDFLQEVDELNEKMSEIIILKQIISKKASEEEKLDSKSCLKNTI